MIIVWAQSLYLLGELMYDGLLSPAEISPLGRHLVVNTGNHVRKDVVVQIVLIAEDEVLQSKLAMFGISTQIPEQIAPITLSKPSCLKEAYSVLGANSKLGLSGRPKRPGIFIFIESWIPRNLQIVQSTGTHVCIYSTLYG